MWTDSFICIFLLTIFSCLKLLNFVLFILYTVFRKEYLLFWAFGYFLPSHFRCFSSVNCYKVLRKWVEWFSIAFWMLLNAEWFVSHTVFRPKLEKVLSYYLTYRDDKVKWAKQTGSEFEPGFFSNKHYTTRKSF